MRHYAKYISTNVHTYTHKHAFLKITFVHTHRHSFTSAIDACKPSGKITFFLHTDTPPVAPLEAAITLNLLSG